MTKWFLYILFSFLPTTVFCQARNIVPSKNDSALVDSSKYFPHIILKEFTVYPPYNQMSRRQQRQYTALELKVRKVYPMARMAAIRVAEYNRVYLSFKKERERKDYIKKVEKELFTEFEGEIRHMTISEGKILIKLIDRETGQSSYEIIKEFKGGFSAFFWQTVARLFGHDLKAAYDPQNEDRMIEYIVMEINMGMLD